MRQMWEQVLAKLVALVGSRTDFHHYGVPFTHIEELRSACDGLHKAGFPRSGREVMPWGPSSLVCSKDPNPPYSGITGERLDGMVFIGCVY